MAGERHQGLVEIACTVDGQGRAGQGRAGQGSTPA